MFQARLSTEREVVLDNVDFTTTGQYRCEVSGDAPMFQTASNEGILYVVGEYWDELKLYAKAKFVLVALQHKCLLYYKCIYANSAKKISMRFVMSFSE